MKRILLPAIIIGSLLLGIALTHNSRAAEPSKFIEEVPAQVLIQEIRALRHALEDFTIGNSRLQVTVELCRLQQATVDRLNDEYNGIHSQIESNEDQIQQMEESFGNLQRLLSTETDQIHRSDIERDQKKLMAAVEKNKQQIQELQGRLTQVSDTLQIERSKLIELIDTLQSLNQSNTIHQSEHK